MRFPGRNKQYWNSDNRETSLANDNLGGRLLVDSRWGQPGVMAPDYGPWNPVSSAWYRNREEMEPAKLNF